jgi:hypothetical protein
VSSNRDKGMDILVSQQVQRRHLKQVQPRHLIYASRSSRERVANACTESTMCPKTNRLKGNASGRRRDRSSTSSLPSWAVCRPEWTGPEEPGAPSPSGGADDEGRGLKGKATNNRKAILCTGGFQPTDQISGWAPEREQTAQNGKCKLLDVR